MKSKKNAAAEAAAAKEAAVVAAVEAAAAAAAAREAAAAAYLKKSGDVLNHAEQIDNPTTSNSCINNYHETITIRFSGESADNGVMPLPDFLTSASGWNDFIRLAASIYLHNKLTIEPFPPGTDLHLMVNAIGKGSITLSLVIEWVATKIAEGGLKKIGEATWEKAQEMIKRLYKHQLDQKRQPRSMREVIEALEKMAKDNNIELPENKTETIEVANQLDASLKHATEPIERSASDIEIQFSKKPNHENTIKINRQDKRHIHSGYYIPKRDEAYFKAQVIPYSLNLNSGHTSVTIKESDNTLFQASASCKIHNPKILKRPFNPYTHSMNSQTPLEVWVKPIFNKTTGTVDKWEVQHETPHTKGTLIEISD